MMIEEDFLLPQDHSLDQLDVWMIFSSGSPPSEFILGIQSDTGNGPDGQFVWQDFESEITSETTGFSQWGYDLWHSNVTISDCPVLSGPETWWLCLRTESDPIDYWLVASNGINWGQMLYFSTSSGSTWQSSVQHFGSDYGAFFILQGSSAPLHRQTWGEIKTLF